MKALPRYLPEARVRDRTQTGRLVSVRAEAARRLDVNVGLRDDLDAARRRNRQLLAERDEARAYIAWLEAQLGEHLVVGRRLAGRGA